MAGRTHPWAICRSADRVASSCPTPARARASALRCAARQTRLVATTAPRTTDGVFRGLTDGRLPTPWIEAFRNQQQQKQSSQAHAARDCRPRERDLSPKRMSDSYHRVVLPLGQDPWLSDTYINSSGHIRLGTILMDLDARKMCRPGARPVVFLFG
jgi:acyl-coenzyme A thioesterase 9